MIKISPNRVPYAIPQPNNMGMVRYALALGVVIAHYKVLAGYDFFFPITSYSCVGGFFALSGFLIYGSYLKRRDARSYILSRARRIMPAYWLTVLIFAIALAGLSELGVREYFTSGGFWKYLAANMAFLNFLEPGLPGVFGGEAVNGSLWTMKVEWALYLSVPGVFWIVRKARRRPAATFIAIYLIAVAYRLLFIYLHHISGKEIYLILERQFFGQLSYFYIGVLIYYYFDFFMRHRRAMLITALVMAASEWVIPYPFHSVIIHPLEMSVLVVWFSMVGKWGVWEGKKDNVSYNVYLLHYPVIQTLIALGAMSRLSMAVSLSLSIICTFILSVILNMAELAIRKHIPKT